MPYPLSSKTYASGTSTNNGYQSYQSNPYNSYYTGRTLELAGPAYSSRSFAGPSTQYGSYGGVSPYSSYTSYSSPYLSYGYGGYGYKPYSTGLTTISEHAASNPQLNTKRRVNRPYIPPIALIASSYNKKMPVVETDEIDVTSPRTVAKPKDISRKESYGTIRRDRAVIRLHTKKLKENPYLKPTSYEDQCFKKEKKAGDKFREKFMIKSKKKNHSGYKRPTLEDIRNQKEELEKEIEDLESMLETNENDEEVKEQLEKDKEDLENIERKLTRRFSKALRKASITGLEENEEKFEKKLSKIRRASVGLVDLDEMMKNTPPLLPGGSSPILGRKSTKRFSLPGNSGGVQPELLDENIEECMKLDDFEKRILAQSVKRDTIRRKGEELNRLSITISPNEIFEENPFFDDIPAKDEIIEGPFGTIRRSTSIIKKSSSQDTCFFPEDISKSPARSPTIKKSPIFNKKIFNEEENQSKTLIETATVKKSPGVNKIDESGKDGKSEPKKIANDTNIGKKPAKLDPPKVDRVKNDPVKNKQTASPFKSKVLNVSEATEIPKNTAGKILKDTDKKTEANVKSSTHLTPQVTPKPEDDCIKILPSKEDSNKNLNTKEPVKPKKTEDAKRVNEKLMEKPISDSKLNKVKSELSEPRKLVTEAKSRPCSPKPTLLQKTLLENSKAKSMDLLIHPEVNQNTQEIKKDIAKMKNSEPKESNDQAKNKLPVVLPKKIKNKLDQTSESAPTTRPGTPTGSQALKKKTLINSSHENLTYNPKSENENFTPKMQDGKPKNIKNINLKKEVKSAPSTPPRPGTPIEIKPKILETKTSDEAEQSTATKTKPQSPLSPTGKVAPKASENLIPAETQPEVKTKHQGQHEINKNIDSSKNATPASSKEKGSPKPGLLKKIGQLKKTQPWSSTSLSDSSECLSPPETPKMKSPKEKICSSAGSKSESDTSISQSSGDSGPKKIIKIASRAEKLVSDSSGSSITEDDSEKQNKKAVKESESSKPGAPACGVSLAPLKPKPSPDDKHGPMKVPDGSESKDIKQIAPSNQLSAIASNESSEASRNCKEKETAAAREIATKANPESKVKKSPMKLNEEMRKPAVNVKPQKLIGESVERNKGGRTADDLSTVKKSSIKSGASSPIFSPPQTQGYKKGNQGESQDTLRVQKPLKIEEKESDLKEVGLSRSPNLVESDQPVLTKREKSKKSVKIVDQNSIKHTVGLEPKNDSKEPLKSSSVSSSSSHHSSSSGSGSGSNRSSCSTIGSVCNVSCHHKCEIFMPNLCGVNQKLLAEALSSVKREGSTSTSTTTSSTLSASTTSSRRMPSPPGNEDFPDEGGDNMDKICPIKNRPKYRNYNIEDFSFLKLLGKGSFGKVLLAELRNSDSYFAIKCLKKDVVLEDDDVECTMIERKVLLLGSKHPYLCHLFCTFQTESHLFFVMEYLNGGDLMFHIQQSGRFSEERARFYGAEIVYGLKFLHKKGIIYRDLKLDNVLLDFEGHIRIADFGMCKLQIYLDRMADTFCGTPEYMSPEIIKGLRYNQCVDWWAFGVLMYEMLIGQSPFSGCDEDDLFWSICNESAHFPRFLSIEAKFLLEALLEKDAAKRLGTIGSPHGEIKDHLFFYKLDWDKLEKREIEPPFKPKLKDPLDTQYFDTTFTRLQARLTQIDKEILRSMDQSQFDGFSYTNPHTTD